MKAKDLAALGALGLAGYAAYNKFGKKDESKKDNYDREGDNRYSSPVVENDSAEVEVPRYVRDRVDRTADIEAEARMGKRSRQEDDVPEAMSRQERDVPNRIIGQDAAGSRFTDKAAAQSGDGGAAARALLKKKSSGPAAVVEAAPKIRAFTPPGAQDSMGAFTSAGQADAAAPGTRAFTPPGYVASANAYNQARTTDTPSSAALGDYARAINPAMHADRMLGASHPSAKITDKLAVDSRVNQAAYLAKKQAEQARIDALRSSGGRRAKGGMVKKMASGGMTSSKPSTASSRGDGIAQRGKTRGQMR